MIVGNSIIKTYPKAKRINALREKPLPLEMLPKTNRMCGKWGHLWEYFPHGRKRCTRLHCEVNEAYTPNDCARKPRQFA